MSVSAVVPYCIGLTELAEASSLETHRADLDATDKAHRSIGYYLRRYVYQRFLFQLIVRPFLRVARQKRPASAGPARRLHTEEISVTTSKPPISPGAAVPSSMASRLWSYLRPELRIFVGAILAMAVVAGSEGVIPKVVNDLLDKGFGGDYAGTLWHVPAILTGVALIRGVAQFASGYLLNLISNRVLLKMRLQMFERLLQRRRRSSTATRRLP